MTHSEIQKVDNELQLACQELVITSTATLIHKMHSLIYTRGARVKYDNPQIDSFDLARTISNQIVVHFQFPLKYSRKHFDHLIFIFKGLMISNPKLLKNSVSQLWFGFLNEIDEDGNDILLYLCLKVRGCRYRFIKYLIKMGCNTQRINHYGQSFFNALELKQNQKLLKKLFEHEIILFYNLTGKIIISTNIFE
ncbi:unnamed protein product [Adineta steineri]|uniref:Ankyrin repeat protein n=1 Tax=Adineta steineri TaxID=433720 RepID=A0A819AKW2_9BILA|nr:unnamed protein product [Adineta steineri]CAF3787000.1 unnamed protein product [Adineta steineri]